MKRCILVFAVANLWSIAVAKDKALAPAGSAGQTLKYSDLVKGGKLPYGQSVTIVGTQSDLECGALAISEVITLSAISASYLGQSGTPATGTISGQNWTAPLGQLPPDTAINLQITTTGTVVPSLQGNIINDLAASADFNRSLQVFFQMTKGEGISGITLETTRLLQSIGGPNGTLTTILQRRLPCATSVDVTAAASAAFTKDLDRFVNLFNADLKDLLAAGSAISGVTAQTPPDQIYQLLKSLKTDADYKSHGLDTAAHIQSAKDSANIYIADYEGVMKDLALTIVSQSNIGVVLDNPSSTADINKYAGFDVGVNYSPRINELRQFDMIHIYPFGPVELSGGGVFTKNWRATYSIGVGISIGDFSGNATSRVKSDNAFVYGLGIRINKYFRVTVGGMVYRDNVGNRLLNEFCIGPSIDITALPALKQVFASSSGKSTSAPAKN